MDDITRKNTSEMIELLREYLEDNNMGSIQISTDRDTEGSEKGVISLPPTPLLAGNSGTLEIFGIRFKDSGNPYDRSVAIYPEINIYNSHKRKIKQYKPKSIKEMFDALTEILKSNPSPAQTEPNSNQQTDIKLSKLEEILRILCLIEEHTRPPPWESDRQWTPHVHDTIKPGT